MSKTETERREIIEKVLGNQRLEGLQPTPFGIALLESYAKGEITPEQIIQKLDKHYKHHQG